MFKLLHAVLLLCTVLLQAHEKKYNLSICAIFKNEDKFLKEWIEFHREIGVDHFYLYDNESTDRSVAVLNPYVRTGIVTLVNWPDFVKDPEQEMWALSTQVTAYENAARVKALKETKWLMCMDVSEFLVPPQEGKMGEVLKRYDDYPGVTMATDFFDASNEAIPKRKLVIENVDLTAPELDPPTEVAKTIFKPEQCEGFRWPPYACIFKNQKSAALMKKGELRVNRYIHRYKGYYHLGKLKHKLDVDNRFLSEEETAAFLDEGYEIEDQDKAIFRFIPELIKKLGFDLWNR